ncbi:hypothetical protein BDV96DRAFT_572868 [Lophiotrema nucula]|uniref:Heterokaryon incompatibility domain-containing protein n=1 Tax=Lophiotrema nucula TaxID=690887 RepID=A0A6A5ZBF2_9PLEO|nr:hypothetical protein BDV96DRAFT_572868 [Lophiotrema nucula]
MTSYDEPISIGTKSNWDAGGTGFNGCQAFGNELRLRGRFWNAMDIIGPDIHTFSTARVRDCIEKSLSMVEASKSCDTPREAVWRGLIMERNINEEPVDESYGYLFDELRKLLEQNSDLKTIEANDYFRILRVRSDSWTVFLTAKGYFGHSWPIVQRGDKICLFSGCRFPMVIRPKGTASSQSHSAVYKLIGWCYIQGIMYGEALSENLAEETIVLR